MDNRGSLDVPEWVSELRRLYVEPKTRAKLRQEGAIAPQKRRRGLPGGRGSRRGATDAPAAPGPAEELTARAAVGSAPVASEALRPAVLAPSEPEPEPAPGLDEAGVSYAPPDRGEEEKVATRLTSYLVATGHAADDQGADPAPARPAAPAAPMDAPAPEDDAARAQALDVSGQAPVEAVARDTEPEESRPRSLAGLADFTDLPDSAGPPEPAASPAGDLHREASRPAHDAAGVLVSTGGDAATPHPAVTSRPDVDAPEAPTSLDPAPALGAPGALPDEPPEGSTAEPPVAPGRPSTVPAVTLSWREAESFEIGVPGVGESEHAIVVEPPSQLVAGRRTRRRDLDTEDDVAPEPVVVEPVPASVPAEEAPATRAAARAASGYQSGKRRRAMVVGLVLVMLAAVAWYFLLRGDGEDAATGAAVPPGGSHGVVAASSAGPGRLPGTLV